MDTCPKCGMEYDNKVSLSARSGRSISVEEYSILHQVAERRQGAPTMKKTRGDTEQYKFVGYLHK